jgi:hypothetical protein
VNIHLQLAIFRIVQGGLGYWPELAHTNKILDLYHKSALESCVEQLLGRVHPCNAGQIALRFPGDLCLDPSQYPDLARMIVGYILTVNGY